MLLEKKGNFCHLQGRKREKISSSPSLEVKQQYFPWIIIIIFLVLFLCLFLLISGGIFYFVAIFLFAVVVVMVELLLARSLGWVHHIAFKS